MRFEEVYGGWQAGRLPQGEAVGLLGVCERTFRRHLARYEASGLEGLMVGLQRRIHAAGDGGWQRLRRLDRRPVGRHPGRPCAGWRAPVARNEGGCAGPPRPPGVGKPVPGYALHRLPHPGQRATGLFSYPPFKRSAP